MPSTEPFLPLGRVCIVTARVLDERVSPTTACRDIQVHRCIVRLIAMVGLYISEAVICQCCVGCGVKLSSFFCAVEGVNPFLDCNGSSAVVCWFRLLEYVPFVALKAY